jgi:galactofuranose transport system permease protein
MRSEGAVSKIMPEMTARPVKVTSPRDDSADEVTVVRPPRPPKRAMPSVLDVVTRHGALVALVVACLIGFARYETFLSVENVLNVLRQNSMVGIVALGMTIVILTGGIDLSVGSLLAVAGIVASALSPYGTGVALVGGVAAAALLGLVNGVLIAKARIQPFVVTLVMMIAARGAALGFTAERSIRLDSAAGGIAWLAQGWIGPIPVPVLILVIVYIIGGVALRFTVPGRHVYAVGDDGNAARLLGLNVDRVLIGTYLVSGICAGLAGVMLAARLGAGQPVAGTGWELDAIAAVVVGGTLLTGGQGSSERTLIGVVLLGVILNLLNLEGTLSPWWQWVIRGAFLLAVVMWDGRTQRNSDG